MHAIVSSPAWAVKLAGLVLPNSRGPGQHPCCGVCHHCAVLLYAANPMSSELLCGGAYACAASACTDTSHTHKTSPCSATCSCPASPGVLGAGPASCRPAASYVANDMGHGTLRESHAAWCTALPQCWERQLTFPEFRYMLHTTTSLKTSIPTLHATHNVPRWRARIRSAPRWPRAPMAPTTGCLGCSYQYETGRGCFPRPQLAGNGGNGPRFPPKPPAPGI